MSAKATGASPQPNGTASHRSHDDGSSERAYTVEQKEAVLRIRRCGPTAFYDILGLESQKATVSDTGIKKAYHKLSLLTHPDKNGYKGADEAFKMVSRAFQILSDPEKKKRYDKFGGDPDNRFSSSGAGAGAAGASPFSAFARNASAGGGGFGFPSAGAGGPMFEEEISPEELFRQFFGGGGLGGGGGGPFGMAGPGLFGNSPFGGSSFVFSGPGGVRVHQFGGNRPRRRPPGTGGGQQEDAPSTGSALLNLLPIIILFVVMPLLSSIFSGGSDGSTWGTSSFRPPPISIDKPNNPKHLDTVRVSKSLKVEYFHNPKDTEKFDPHKWAQLDKIAEGTLLRTLDAQCLGERHEQQRLFTESQGWFSIDREKEEMARTMPKPACERLQGYTHRRSSWL